MIFFQTVQPKQKSKYNFQYKANWAPSFVPSFISTFIVANVKCHMSNVICQMSYIECHISTIFQHFYNFLMDFQIENFRRTFFVILSILNIPWGHVRPHNKFVLHRFNCFDVFHLKTNRQSKYIYR